MGIKAAASGARNRDALYRFHSLKWTHALERDAGQSRLLPLAVPFPPALLR